MKRDPRLYDLDKSLDKFNYYSEKIKTDELVHYQIPYDLAVLVHFANIGGIVFDVFTGNIDAAGVVYRLAATKSAVFVTSFLYDKKMARDDEFKDNLYEAVKKDFIEMQRHSDLKAKYGNSYRNAKSLNGFMIQDLEDDEDYENSADVQYGYEDEEITPKAQKEINDMLDAADDIDSGKVKTLEKRNHDGK